MIVSIETHETKEGGVAEDRREKECWYCEKECTEEELIDIVFVRIRSLS